MNKIFLLLILLLALSGCKAPQMLEFRGIEAPKLTTDKQSHQLQLQVGVKFYNPNHYPVFLKKSKMNVQVNSILIGQAVGKIKKQRVAGTKEGVFELVITTDRDKLLKAALGSILKIITGNKAVKLKVDGYVKGGVLFFSKKFPFSVEKEIDLDLKGAD